MLFFLVIIDILKSQFLVTFDSRAKDQVENDLRRLRPTSAVALINDAVLKELRAQSISPLDYFQVLEAQVIHFKGLKLALK